MIIFGKTLNMTEYDNGSGDDDDDDDVVLQRRGK